MFSLVMFGDDDDAGDGGGGGGKSYHLFDSGIFVHSQLVMDTTL